MFAQMEPEYGGPKKQNSRMAEIVYNYIKIFLENLQKRDQVSLEEARYITTSEIVPTDFFDDGNRGYSSCDNDQKVLSKDFGFPYILFNDLKNSTKILDELESSNNLCIYSLYIYFSSKMLGEVLDLLDGSMIECTGDGNYSIFTEEKFDFEELRDLGIQFFNHIDNDSNISRIDYSLYCEHLRYKLVTPLSFFKKYPYYRDSMRRSFNNSSEVIRCLFFHIFMLFNIEINKVLRMQNPFLTRIGCVKGKCKITRIEVDGHIKQDKLIGSAVHRAAHQASEKL
ncbi:MAG: hypothetical protein KAJ49_09570 [Arcobacteraceae bacterium]|nr:hypothetical protein [Arcobacteraceae bacterium]